MDCLFCRIVEKLMPAEILYESPEILAFRDINPVAPTHLLIIPKKHIATINEVDSGDESLLGQMILTAKELAKKEQIEASGYRLNFNVNSNGCQAVYHIHLHLLGGRQMAWPPG